MENKPKIISTLIIEDSEEDRLVVQRYLSKINSGYFQLTVRAEFASSLQEAVLLLDSNQYDLVFLDLGLPDSQGLGGFDLIKKHVPTSTAIVIVTGHNDPQLGIEGIQKGAQDYLLKNELSENSLAKTITYAIERSKLQNKLEQLNIQQANSLKMATLGEMAGRIAHEINNPLSIIYGYAERLKLLGQSDKLDKESIEASVEKIISTTARITKIVKGLKIYSRSKDDDPHVEVNLLELIDNCLSLCHEKFRLSEIQLEIDVPKDVVICCNDTQISQVILNLLHNSYDALLEKKDQLKEKRVKISVEQTSVHTKIIYTDSGSIENTETIKNLFKPYYTTKPSGVGTGLGLSIAKTIMASHDGKIFFDDTEANTTFVLEFKN